MPYYKGVIDELRTGGHAEEACKVADRLLRLRTKLRHDIPDRNVDQSVLIATWNLREFGRNEKCGKRLGESILYIAEIISRFDIVAIQEVNERLADFQFLMELLGRWWEYIVTDVTPGPSGNKERIAFVYDSRKLRFDHLAGELSLAPTKNPTRQPARSPFICAFRTGWRRISMCSVHIYYGSAKANDAVRVEEIREIAKLLDKRNRNRQETADGEPDCVILLGDFNIFNRSGDDTTTALEENRFVIPKPMLELPATNLGGDKYFDRIAFHDPTGKLKSSCAGVFDFTTILYAESDISLYESAMIRSAEKKFRSTKKLTSFYKEWRTFQISDHLPLWVELRTNFAEAYLAKAMRACNTPAEAKAATP
jgi:endonuclease/exonuclease/phosphatase family metal-dependent hydrolase